MFCTNCGKSITPDAKFCTLCGALQTTAAQVAVPAPAPAPASAPAPGFQGYAAPLENRPSAHPANAARPAPTRTITPVIWAVAGALLVASLGGLAYWGWSNKVAAEQAASKLAATREQGRVADESSNQTGPQSSDPSDVAAAQQALDRRIEAEEAQAQTVGSGQNLSKGAVAKK